MNKNLALFITVLFFCVNQSFSQSKRLADKYYSQFAYPKAAKLYEAIYRKGDSTKYILTRIADSYYKNSDTKNSEFWYEKLVTIYKDELLSDDLFRYAQSLRSNGNFVKSDSLLAYIGDESLEKVKGETNYLLDKSNNKDYRISVRNLALNTEYSDFGAFTYNNQVYFTSASPVNEKKQKLYKWNNQPFLNLYKANSYVIPLENSEKDSVFELEGKMILPSPINTKYHESSVVFTKDGKTMYFTRVNYDGRKTRKDQKDIINLKLFKAELIEGEWKNIAELPFCSNEYSVAHPALSKDEKTLYFTSDMPGTLGESDIFKVSVNGDKYGIPENLGNKINTKEKETFPFIGNDGTLYFSSNGHRGFGLLDIFQVKLDKSNNYNKVTNLGTPFNSNKDDFSFFIDKDGRKGFFSSNRKKGKGDDDIYSFMIYANEKPKIDKVKSCNQLITGIVKNSKNNQPISSATVKLINSYGEVMREVLSDKNGVYKFRDFSCQKGKFRVLGGKLDHKPDSKIITSTVVNNKNLKADLNLIPLIIGNQIVINPIYFDFNKLSIREDAKYELEDIVTVMNNHPKMIIRIESHTDSRGNKEYNRKLSDGRAKSTRNYIISRGIESHRIVSAIGYGESQLLNHCNDNNRHKCTEEEHQLNRRSYFYIVSGGDDVNIENIKPKVIDESFRSFNKERQHLIRNKKVKKSNLLKLLNEFKREKSRSTKKEKCRRGDNCE